MNDFVSKFDTKIDSLSLELCLLDEMDNPVSVAALSSLLETKESNEKHSLRIFDKTDNKDDVENYLYADKDKFFENFVSDGIFIRKPAVSDSFGSYIPIQSSMLSCELSLSKFFEYSSKSTNLIQKFRQ